jgi:hypothetical protein
VAKVKAKRWVGRKGLMRIFVCVALLAAEAGVVFAVSLREFLAQALVPVGHVVYVFSGGWDVTDTQVGESVLKSVRDQLWAAHFAAVDPCAYDYRGGVKQIPDPGAPRGYVLSRERNNGLDCSGYAAYSVQQTFLEKDLRATIGSKMGSATMCFQLEAAGWGKVLDLDCVEPEPGDLLFSPEFHHICILLGVCPDGSLLCVDCTPPCLRITGTPALGGSQRSQAVELAEACNRERYPEMWKKWHTHESWSRDRWRYLGFKRFRFAPELLTDPDGLREKTAPGVLAVLYSASGD